MQHFSTWALGFRAPLLFAICAASGRFVFQTVETRYQIATFWMLAVVLELCGPMPATHGATRRIAANAAAATIAAVSVKWYLEGISPLVLGLFH